MPPGGGEPPGPTCNGSELMAEFRQMWLPAKNGQRVDPKRIPPPHPQPQAALGEPPPELGRPRHTQLTAGPKCTHSGTSVLAPGATRPRLGNHEGPRTRGCGQPTPTWRRRNPQGWISPTRPLRRPAVTISQQEPVFLGRHKDTQWHRCQPRPPTLVVFWCAKCEIQIATAVSISLIFTQVTISRLYEE